LGVLLEVCEGAALAEAVAVESEDLGVVDEAVDGGDGHDGVGEDAVPVAEGVVGGDKQAAGLVAVGDELEEDRGLHLGALDVADVVEDQEAVLVELGQGVGERQGLFGDLQLLDEVGGGGEADAEALGDEAVADGGGDVDPAHARGAIKQQILSQGYALP